MRKLYIVIAISWFMLGSMYGTKYAGEIFQISNGVVNQAMGNTGLTFSGSLSAAYWNPALLSSTNIRGMELVHTQHFEGLMQQNQLSLIHGNKTFGSIIINHIGIDDIKLTELENPADTLSNSNRPIVIKTVSNNDFIIIGGISRRIGNTTAIGLSPKLAYRSLAENSGYGFGADIGFLWELNSGMAFGANLRDFFSTQILWENGTYETVTPNLDLETAYRGFVFSRNIPIHLALRTQIYAEDRDEAATLAFSIFSADFHGGLCINPIPQLRLMGGYDIDSFTAGIGIQLRRFNLDYAFKNGATDGLGSSQKVSLGILW